MLILITIFPQGTNPNINVVLVALEHFNVMTEASGIVLIVCDSEPNPKYVLQINDSY